MKIQVVLNSFATDVFRRQADYDYIASRMNYRMRLTQQFLWAAQQAVEKYLKAILLFNGKSARYIHEKGKGKRKGRTEHKELRHDLIALNNKVEKIEYLKYELPEWAFSFMKYLSELGGDNRYLTKCSYSTRDAMHKLDELVWSIRKYCQYITDRGLGCKEEVPGMRKAVINAINNPYRREYPMTFKLSRGELEKILKRSQKDPARKALVWANFYYGKRSKKVVHFTAMSSSEIPPQFRSWFKNEADREIIAEYIKL